MQPAVITFLKGNLLVATTADGRKIKFERVPYKRGERVLIDATHDYVDVARFEVSFKKRERKRLR